MIELISLIAKSLVKQPDAVSVTMVQKGNMEVYELHVAPEDMGKVIGKQGRIAKAIRAVVKAAAIKENKKISVTFAFTATGTRNVISSIGILPFRQYRQISFCSL